MTKCLRHAILILTTALALSGCATGNPYAVGYQAFHDMTVAKWGPERTWTTEQRQAYLNGVLALANKYKSDSEARYAAVPRYQQQAPIVSYSDPMTIQNARSGGMSGYRSWHNSDGSSGQFIPYPGGNGGTIYNSDGSATTVDPAIGQ